jgi:hypothetical protein
LREWRSFVYRTLVFCLEERRTTYRERIYEGRELRINVVEGKGMKDFKGVR